MGHTIFKLLKIAVLMHGVTQKICADNHSAPYSHFWSSLHFFHQSCTDPSLMASVMKPPNKIQPRHYIGCSLPIQVNFPANLSWTLHILFCSHSLQDSASARFGIPTDENRSLCNPVRILCHVSSPSRAAWRLDFCGLRLNIPCTITTFSADRDVVNAHMFLHCSQSPWSLALHETLLFTLDVVLHAYLSMHVTISDTKQWSCTLNCMLLS